MTPDELCQIGQSLYGPFWKAKLAAALPVSPRTVSYWLARRKKNQPVGRSADQGFGRWLGAGCGEGSEGRRVMSNSDEDAIDLCRRVARIMGPQSGAALAVAEYDRLEAEGKKPVAFKTRLKWIVVHDKSSLEGIA